MFIFYPSTFLISPVKSDATTSKIPTVAMKFGSEFSTQEYLTSSGGVEKTLYMTNVDFELFKETYVACEGVENFLSIEDFNDNTDLIDTKIKELEHARDSINAKITELKKYASDGKSAVASAVTEMGVSTETDATFSKLASGIRSIVPTLNLDAGTKFPLSISTFKPSSSCITSILFATKICFLSLSFSL